LILYLVFVVVVVVVVLFFLVGATSSIKLKAPSFQLSLHISTTFSWRRPLSRYRFCSAKSPTAADITWL